MSDFAFFRFLSYGMLSSVETQDRDEITRLTEEVLHARGLQCDASIAKISEEELKAILQQVRELRKKRKKKSRVETDLVAEKHEEAEDEVAYVR